MYRRLSFLDATAAARTAKVTRSLWVKRQPGRFQGEAVLRLSAGEACMTRRLHL